MSHSTCLVIGANPELQLEPFDENLEMPRYVKYTKDGLIAKGRKEIEHYKNNIYAQYLENPEKYLANSSPGHTKYITEEFPKKLNWSDEEIYADQIENYDDENIGGEGEVYSTYNPKSKWDWYSLGGRWTGMLKLKEGATGEIGSPGIMTEDAPKGYCDSALIKDIDFEGMVAIDFEKYSKLYEEFEKEVVEDSKKHAIKAIFDYGIRNIGTDEKFIPETKEAYVKRNTQFHTFAVLKDGEWFERGEMGWWGIVKDEKDPDEWQNKFDELLKSLPEDTLISVYDVHI